MNEQPKKSSSDRRKFIKTAGIAAAGFMIVPRHVLGGKGFTAPSDKVNIAGIGVGGRGNSLLKSMAKTDNIAFLCDVDDRQAKATRKRHPNAPYYKDYRKMLDKEHKDIDAVVIATPDHQHAVMAMAAMELRKHVYVEKPLTHDIYEARKLTKAAAKYKVVTQMGNHGSSGEGIRQIQEWINAGLIGKVTKVHCFTNRPVWPQGIPTPTQESAIPKELDWDLWLGTAPHRNFHSSYVPFNWRGWWDFGTGALGDMGCHIIDPAFRALKLGYPISAEASVAQQYIRNWNVGYYPDSCPASSKVHIKFPARGDMPPVELVWYDGGIMPARPDELEANEPFGDGDGGCLFEGTDGKLLCGTYGRNPRLLPTKMMKHFKPPKPTIKRIKDGMAGHQLNFLEGIRNGAPTTSDFSYAGPFTETVLMGNLAIRCYNYRTKKGKTPGRIKLLWNGEKMKVTNFKLANQFIKRDYRKGWEL